MVIKWFGHITHWFFYLFRGVFNSKLMEEQNDKKNQNYKIVGVNLLAVVVYSLLCRVAGGSDGWTVLMLIIPAHVLFCLILGFDRLLRRIKIQSAMWFLSALMVLIIGFSTCVNVFTISI